MTPEEYEDSAESLSTESHDHHDIYTANERRKIQNIPWISASVMTPPMKRQQINLRGDEETAKNCRSVRDTSLHS